MSDLVYHGTPAQTAVAELTPRWRLKSWSGRGSLFVTIVTISDEPSNHAWRPDERRTIRDAIVETVPDSESVIYRILTGCQTWAVVGLSTNRRRAAYGVARFLQERGKRIVPVHPSAETVHGERGYPALADIPFPVDSVDVFVRSELAGAIADQAVEIGAKAVWFQLGVVDDAAYDRVTEAGLEMVMDRCPAIEWPRLGPAA